MLRTILVLTLILVGVFYSVQGPFYALLFYIWYAYFRPDLWMWGGLVAQWDLSFYIGAFTVATTLLTGKKLRLDRQVVLLTLFLLQILLSAALSGHPNVAMPFARGLVIRLVITYLIVVLVTDRGKLRLLLVVMALSLAFEGAKQGWAQMVLRPGLPHTQPMPFLGDNNAVALGMTMLIPLLAVLAQTSRRDWARAGYIFLIVGVLYRALATYSRGGFLSCGALGAVYWWRSKRRVLTLVAILLLGGGVLAVMPDAFWERMRTTLTYQEEEEQSALGRLHFWRVAVTMANRHPLTGVGPGVYPFEYDRFDWTSGAYGSARAVHSSWFGMLAELGYPGVLLYVAIMVMAFHNCRRVRLRARAGAAPAELGPYAAALEAGLVVWVVGSSFLGVPQMEMPYHLVGLTMALTGLAEAPEPEPARPSREPTS